MAPPSSVATASPIAKNVPRPPWRSRWSAIGSVHERGPVVERERDDGVGDPATRLDEWHRAWHMTTLGRATCAGAPTRSRAPVVEPPELHERRAGFG